MSTTAGWRAALGDGWHRTTNYLRGRPAGRWRPLGGALLVVLSTFAFLAAGYHLTYTLFFAQTPIDNIADERAGGEQEDFLYRGIAYFHGTRLSGGEAVNFRYVVPRRVAAKSGKEIEFFIRMDEYADAEGDASPGRLVVEQSENAERQVIELEPILQQRHSVAWQPEELGWRSYNDLEVSFEAAEGVESVVFGTNIRNVTFWPRIAGWLLVGVLALALAMRLRPSISFLAVIVVGGPLAVMFYVHSGAFISNELFADPLRMRGFGRSLLDLVSEGHLGQSTYRGAGVIIVPLISTLIEWRLFDPIVVLDTAFANIFPTWRYVMFAWTAVSLAMLLIALNRYMGWAVALTTGLLTAVFVPYMGDLYFPDLDAYLIPPMMMLAGLFIALCHRPRAPISWGLLIAIGLVMTAMMSFKIQAAVLLLILPVSLLAHSVLVDRRWQDRTALAMLGIALIAVVAGGALRAGFHHPERNVGIEGVEFEKNNIWTQIFFTVELYDRGSNPHGTEVGGGRRIIMEEMLGLEGASYPHHSQRAQDEVYRPAVLNMFRERPGHFYAYAYLKGYRDSVRFLKYGQSRPGFAAAQSRNWVEQTQFGEFWKIAPISLAIQTMQFDLPKSLDLFLLILALVGISLVRRVDVMMFLYGCAAAMYAYGIFIHILTRYFNFMNFALLIGLAVFIVTMISALHSTARRPAFLS